MAVRLDSSLTFDTFDVSLGNRRTVSAAQRAADAPGSYHPLILIGPPGAGKTHLLHAIGNRVAAARPKATVVYEPLAEFAERLEQAVAADRVELFRRECLRIDLLLLDGAECLAGRVRTQDELLVLWGRLGQNGSQVVVTSELPPTAIDRLNVRLEARFARLLAVALQPPNAAPPAADGPALSVAREAPSIPVVPQRVAARATRGLPEQTDFAYPGGFISLDLPGGQADASVAPRHAAHAAASAPAAAAGAMFSAGTETDNPFGAFLDDITATVAEAVDAVPWRVMLANTIDRWAGTGIRTRHLEAALQRPDADAAALIRAFESDAARLQEVAAELRQLLPEAAALPLLHEPERLAQAEALLRVARAAAEPFLAPPERTLSGLATHGEVNPSGLAVARRIASVPSPEHNPLFVHGPDARCTDLLAGIGNAALATYGADRVAFVTGASLREELAAASAVGYPQLWRRRHRSAELLLVDGIDALSNDETSQDELCTLLDELQQRGPQVVLSGRHPLVQSPGLTPRLRSRLQAGRSLDVSGTAPRRLLRDGGGTASTVATQEAAVAPGSGAPGGGAARAGDTGTDSWFFDAEKLDWEWSALEERLIEELG
jgi:chromosomal replication initiation ATPase DnaA